MRAGALTLAAALPYMPVGVALAVVDPRRGRRSARGAGAAQRAEEERLLVGPDNGLLMAAAERLGGVVGGGRRRRLPRASASPISRTFHGRDVFAPVAAALAAGEPLASVGEPLPAEELVRLELPRRACDGGLVAHVIRRDTSAT